MITRETKKLTFFNTDYLLQIYIFQITSLMRIIGKAIEVLTKFRSNEILMQFFQILRIILSETVKLYSTIKSKKIK